MPKNHFKTNLFFVQLKHLKTSFTFGKKWKYRPCYKKVQISNFGLFDILCWPLPPPFWLFPYVGTFFNLMAPLTHVCLNGGVTLKTQIIWRKKIQRGVHTGLWNDCIWQSKLVPKFCTSILKIIIVTPKTFKISSFWIFNIFFLKFFQESIFKYNNFINK